MNARILAIDSDEHREVQALLPWHGNGTLGAAERSRVEAHVAQCARCQADLAFQLRLRDLPGADGTARADDVERGWSALRRRLEGESRTAPEAPQAAPAWRWPAPAWRWPRWGRVALALNAVVVAGLVLALYGATHPTEPYRALGAVPTATAPNALVVFRADATEAQIRGALRAADARLVGGPTVTDAYLLRLATPGAQTLARLRDQAAVLRVESLDAEATR